MLGEKLVFKENSEGGWDEERFREIRGFALADETSDATTGQKIILEWPDDFRMTRVFATVDKDNPPTGSSMTFDVEDEGVSTLNAVVSIAASGTYAETTSFASAANYYDLFKGDTVSIDIDQIGSTTAGKAPKLFIEGYKL